jgi:repressor LexA
MGERTWKVLDFIIAFTDRRGLPPTMRDIAKHFEFSSTNGARYHLARLQAEGMIVREGRIARGIKVTSTGRMNLLQRVCQNQVVSL